jgi:hypothetical protein
MLDMVPPITCTSLFMSCSHRLVNSKAPPVTLYGTDVFDKGIAWGPKLTFANRRFAARRRPSQHRPHLRSRHTPLKQQPNEKQRGSFRRCVAHGHMSCT